MQILRPTLIYASPIWGYAAHSNINLAERAQNLILRTITKANWQTLSPPMGAERADQSRSLLSEQSYSKKFSHPPRPPRVTATRLDDVRLTLRCS
ncbi:hypothetical protein TNCV_4879121 [Trichonephila clavipes]|nr:hypothetical protein TNCV_4879121 [Trichonephila clavipes]